MASLCTARHEASLEFSALGQANHVPTGLYLFPSETTRASLVHSMMSALCLEHRSSWGAAPRACSRAPLLAAGQRKKVQCGLPPTSPRSSSPHPPRRRAAPSPHAHTKLTLPSHARRLERRLLRPPRLLRRSRPPPHPHDPLLVPKRAAHRHVRLAHLPPARRPVVGPHAPRLALPDLAAARGPHRAGPARHQGRLQAQRARRAQGGAVRQRRGVPPVRAPLLFGSLCRSTSASAR